MKQTKKKLAAAVKASGTTLTEVFGVGPGNRRDGARRGRGPVPVPGPRSLRRLHWNRPKSRCPPGSGRCTGSLRRGNRHINHAVHMAAITQIRTHSEGRACYDKKLAEGKTPKEALRALKHRISDAIYRQMRTGARRAATGSAQVTGPEGQPGNDTDGARPTLTPKTSSSAQPLPDLSPPYAPPQPPSRENAAHEPQKDVPNPLTQRGFVMVGLGALGVQQLRHAEQVDLVRRDRRRPAAERPHMPNSGRCTCARFMHSHAYSLTVRSTLSTIARSLFRRSSRKSSLPTLPHLASPTNRRS